MRKTYKMGRESFLDKHTVLPYMEPMPRRPRLAAGGFIYHVLNRRVGRLPLFNEPGDYAAFERILQEAVEQTRLRVLAYCLMPTHWHLLLWPRRNGELSEVLRWITVTHTQRWHAQHQTAGTGPIYQGRFRAFPVQMDEHIVTVARYIERNPLRANLVRRAEEWRWSSLWRWAQKDAQAKAWLSDWPVTRPRNWIHQVNQPESAADLEAVRTSVARGRPFGTDRWVRRIAKRFGLESTLRPRGRPKGS